MFDTKIAFIVRNDLATWQRINVVAFLATGIASAAPEILGKPYVDTRFKTKLTAYIRIRVAFLQWPRLWYVPGPLR